MVWSGATPEDVEAAITAPLERELLNLGGLKEVTSWSQHGATQLSLTYEEGADMAFALEEVKERVASIRNLPASAEEPVIARVVRYEPVARLLVTGDDGRLVTLGDVASVERRTRGSEALIFHEGRPAVNLRLRRARGSGSLESARILHETNPSRGPAGRVEVVVRRGEDDGARCSGHENLEQAEGPGGVSRHGEGLDAMPGRRIVSAANAVGTFRAGRERFGHGVPLSHGVFAMAPWDSSMGRPGRRPDFPGRQRTSHKLHSPSVSGQPPFRGDRLSSEYDHSSARERTSRITE